MFGRETHSHDVHVYVCMYAAILRNADKCFMWVLACRFLAGHLSLTFHKDGERFSTLKIDGGVYNAFRAC